MSVTLGPVSPLFIGLMLIMPVVPVPVLTAVPDKHLTMRVSTEMVELLPMLVITQISLGLVDHFFMAVVKIKIAIAGRQLMGERPVTPVQVDELMVGHIIVSLNIRNIIILHVIVANRSPGRLLPDIDRYAYLRLCPAGQQRGRYNRGG